jgi:hypothetical protein
MIETFHPTLETQVPEVDCDHCGKRCTTQIYTLTLDRPKLTREWVFDTLTCLRDWVAPLS